MTTPILRLKLATFVLASLLAATASAQTYPTKPVNLVVTVPAGGSIDAVARIVAQGLGGALGQPVVVQNRAGAGGTIAADYVAKAPPDGYTLLITSSSTLAIEPYLYKSLPFDPEKNFAPVIMPARQNLILVVHPKLNVSTYKEFVPLLKAQSAKLNYGSSGEGTLPHLAGVLFNAYTGTNAHHVPYKGIAPAMNALVSGEVDFMFDSASTIEQIRSGKLRALAVIGPKRLPVLPEVRTFRELGLPQMEAARAYYAILAPAGTPADVVQRLNRDIARVLRQPGSAEKISTIGLENATSTPEELASALRDDLKHFAGIVKQANIAAQ
ncbi:MAG: tripartite tricarboxylate transporter substrate binding protein [Betaproteobacteria bacterium]|nr:tripartite tricarboxylate transporter substrate binding protein [Betaproteobacteria bacterium]